MQELQLFQGPSHYMCVGPASFLPTNPTTLLCSLVALDVSWWSAHPGQPGRHYMW